MTPFLARYGNIKAMVLSSLLVAASWTATSARSPVRIGYSALIQHTDGARKQHFNVLSFGDGYRIEYLGPARQGRPKLVELRRQAKPQQTPIAEIEWAYDPQRRFATPTLASCKKALEDAAKRMGEAEVRHRYNLPLSFQLVRPREGPGSTPHEHARPHREPLLRPRSAQFGPTTPVRTEAVAGRICTVVRISRKHGDTSEHTEWVDRETGLVLRSVQIIRFGANSPAPPLRRERVVLRFNVRKQISADSFELPPDCTANVPSIFGKVRLRQGVKVTRLPGYRGSVGIGFSGDTKSASREK